MVIIEDGIPIIGGRRFPWVWKVYEEPNECGARCFALMMENGWTVWIYFNDAGEIGAHAYSRPGPGAREAIATRNPEATPYSYCAGDWCDIVLTAERCLDFIDRVAHFSS